MAIIVNFAGASLRKPGAYSRLRVAEGGAAQAQLGVVAIVGEADQGDPLSAETGLSAVTFSPEQFTAIQDKYISGPLVDAARLAITPSNDPQIVGGAQQLLVLKTNQSLKAGLTLATAYGDVDAQIAGAPGNNISNEVSDVAGVAEVTTVVARADTAGDLEDTFFLLNSPTTAYYVWYDVGTGSDPLIPGRTGITVVLISGDADTVVATKTAAAIDLEADFDVPVPSTATFIITNAAVGDVTDAVDGAVPTAHTSITTTTQGVNLKKVITVADAVSGESEISDPLGGQGVMTIQVTEAGVTAATLTITGTLFSTTITGGTAPGLSIDKTQFTTISQLVDFINAQTGYVAAVVDASQQNEPLSVMDRQTAVDIHPNPYKILRDAQDVDSFFAESGLVDFTKTDPGGFAGLPDALAKTFLTGGVKGGTTNANILAALDELLKVRVNFVIPLFSRDATADIADSLTDATSTYTIDATHVSLRTHVVQASTVKGRKERQGYASFKGTLVETKDKAFNLGSSRVTLTFQDVDVQNAAGDLFTAQPHMLSVINGGMKAAAVVGLPNTFKLANINGFSHVDFDPEVDGDEGIDANLSFVERAPGGGFRWVLDNSTYGLIKDAWIFNRPSVLYAADTAAFSIRLNIETFIGQRNSDVSPETVKNLLISVMDGLRTSGIIVPDANSQGKGFKDLAVNFNGSIIQTSVTLVLVEGFEFALTDITVTRAVS